MKDYVCEKIEGFALCYREIKIDREQKYRDKTFCEFSSCFCLKAPSEFERMKENEKERPIEL